MDDLLASYLDAYPETTHRDIRMRPVMAGNTIYPDYFLVRKFLPRFKERLNYRMFDVSTLKLEWQYHYRGAPFHKQDRADVLQQYYRGSGPIEGNKHDAYYDIQASMAELAYYRTKTTMQGDGLVNLIDTRSDETVPLRLISSDDLDAWLASAPDSAARWVRASAFTAKPGSVCLVPAARRLD